MTESKSLIKMQLSEIAKFKKAHDVRELQRSHIAYSGSPIEHPHDQSKLILVADPYSESSSHYVFRKIDISHVEELQSIVNLEGETFVMVRIWIKKRSIGVKCTPFFVEQTPTLDF